MKQDIHLLIDRINDIEVLYAVKTLLLKKATIQTDWWETRSEEERAEILQGLNEANHNNLLTHDEVMDKYKKWLH